MAVAGDSGQEDLDAYTLSGGQIVATAPVSEAYAETNEVWVLSINDEVWVLSINDELGAGTLAAAAPAAAPNPKQAGPRSAAGRAGTQAVCNPTGLRNNNGPEYHSWFRVPNPSSLESWFSGKLEMRMIVVARNGVEIKNAYFGKIKRKTIKNGAVEWRVCSVGGDGGVNYPPQWVQLDFGVTKTLRRMVVYTSAGYPIRDFDIQVWNGITWTTPAGGQVRGNTALQVTVNYTQAQSSRLIRVYGLSGPTHQQGYVRVNEFEVYAS